MPPPCASPSPPRRYHEGYREHLRNGLCLVRLRLLRPTDRHCLAEAFSRLSDESRYHRFLSAKRSLTEAELDYLTDCDGENHLAILAVRLNLRLGERETIGAARFVRFSDHPTMAELAIALVDAYHGRGLGRILVSRLGQAALERGIVRFRAYTAQTNTRFRQLVYRLTPHVTHRTQDGIVRLDFPVAA